MTEPMNLTRISWQQIPRTSSLFLDYLYDFARVKDFYAFNPWEGESFQQAAGRLDFDQERREAVTAVLAEQNREWGCDERCRENLELLKKPDTVAVVTGQQVGLFGGPAYSVLKAVTTIQQARKLSSAGLTAIPIFWMPAYDHDFAEVRQTNLLGADGQMHELRDENAPPEGTPVGDVTFGPEIAGQVEKLLGLTAEEFRPAVERLLRGYAEGESYVTAFAQLFQQLFAGQGLVLLDPRDARLQKLAEPIYARVLEENEGLVTGLLERNDALARAGYPVQVEVNPESSLLFMTEGGQRKALRRNGGAYSIDGKEKMPTAKVRKRLRDAPECFTPSALLRPVVQDWLLPTVATVTGPAETAYLAQSAVLYEKLLGRMPVVVPRTSATLLEPHVGRTLEKYNLAVEDVFKPFDDFHAQVAEQKLPRELRERLEKSGAQLEVLLDDISSAVTEIDPTLKGAVETSRNKMAYQLEKIKGMVARAQAQRSDVVKRHSNLLHGSLFPNRGLQERSVNFLSFAGRHGSELVGRLLEIEGLLGRDHLVIRL